MYSVIGHSHTRYVKSYRHVTPKEELPKEYLIKYKGQQEIVLAENLDNHLVEYLKKLSKGRLIIKAMRRENMVITGYRHGRMVYSTYNKFDHCICKQHAWIYSLRQHRFHHKGDSVLPCDHFLQLQDFITEIQTCNKRRLHQLAKEYYVEAKAFTFKRTLRNFLIREFLALL